LVWSAGLIKYLIAVRHRAPPPSWIVIGSGAALVGYLVTALFAPPLMRFTTSATVWLVIGLAMGSALATSRPTADRKAGNAPDADEEITATAVQRACAAR
jgi:hypothetical protein